MIDNLMAELYNQQMIESLKRWGVRFRKPCSWSGHACVYVYAYQEELLLLAGFRPGMVRQVEMKQITCPGLPGQPPIVHNYPLEIQIAYLDVKKPWSRCCEAWYLPSQDPFGEHCLTQKQLNMHKYWDGIHYYRKRADAIDAYKHGRQPLPLGIAASLAAGYRYDETGRTVIVPGSPAEPPAPKSSWLPQRLRPSPSPQSECSAPSQSDPCAHQSADEQSTHPSTGGELEISWFRARELVGYWYRSDSSLPLKSCLPVVYSSGPLMNG